MRVLLCLLVMFGSASSALAQECAPQPLIYVYWGTYGVSHIPESTLTTGWVPETEVWWVQDAAASIDVPGPELPLGDYILLDNTKYTDGTSWYLTGIAKATATNTTPVVVTNRPRLLLPGHRLSVRTNIAIPSYARMGIHATGLRYPIACLSRLMGVDEATSSGTAAAPDTTVALRAYLRQVFTAAASVP